MGIKLSSPDLDQPQQDNGDLKNPSPGNSSEPLGIESLIRIEVDSFNRNDSLNQNIIQSSSSALNTEQTLLRPAKHQRSHSIGKFILTSMIASNNVENDPVFDSLKLGKQSSSLSDISPTTNNQQIPTLNLTSVHQEQTSSASPPTNIINSERKSFKLSTSLLNIGSSTNNNNNSSTATMKTPRATQFNIYSKLMNSSSNISHQTEHLKRLQDCKLILILGGVDSGKTTLMEMLTDYKYKTEELKFFRDSILLYCIYCLKILTHSQHEVNLEEIQNSTPEFIQKFSDLIQQFQSMIHPESSSQVSPRSSSSTLNPFHSNNNFSSGSAAVPSTPNSSQSSKNSNSPNTNNNGTASPSPNIFSLNPKLDQNLNSSNVSMTINVSSENNSVSSSQQVLSRLWKQKEFFKVMDQLWKHPFIAKSYRERNSRKTPLPILGENIEYFLNDGRVEKLKKISELTKQDIVRSKILSLESMPLKDVIKSSLIDHKVLTRKFLLLETFGWREKRALYAPYLEKQNLHCIIFTVSLSDIDMLSFEDLISPTKLENKPTNRLLDSLYYFEQVFSKTELRQSPIQKILLFTKVDSFIRKVSKGEASNSLSKYFSDFTGNRKNPKQVFNYIVERFNQIQHRYSVSYHNHYYNGAGAGGAGGVDNDLSYQSSITIHAVNTLQEFDVNQVMNSVLFNVRESFINCRLDARFENLMGRRLLYKLENGQFTDVKISSKISSSSAQYSDLDFI